jgi:hypothetical protein
MPSKKIVYAAQSKAYFYCRDIVCEFVFREGAVPLHPFRMFDYFLGDRVDRDTIREANSAVIAICHEVWVFGEVIADGVLLEIALATRAGKPIRYFTIDNDIHKIRETSIAELEFEREVYEETQLDKHVLKSRIAAGSADALAHALRRRLNGKRT